MTDATATKQAELESDEEDDADEDPSSAQPGRLFRDASSSLELPPVKRAKVARGGSVSTKSQPARSDGDNSETEASEASTEAYSDSDQLVRTKPTCR